MRGWTHNNECPVGFHNLNERLNTNNNRLDSPEIHRRQSSPWKLKGRDSVLSWDTNLDTCLSWDQPCYLLVSSNLRINVMMRMLELTWCWPDRAAKCEESDSSWPFIGSVIPDPVLDDDSGDTAGPPSPAHDGDKLDPEPVDPGDVVGTPVNWNKENLIYPDIDNMESLTS